MNRLEYYKTETVNDVQELDFLNSGLSGFKMTYQPQFYTVTEVDMMRPDRISYSAYNTIKYWWLICFVNGISNPLMDMKAGMQIMIPNLIDVYNFYKKSRT